LEILSLVEIILYLLMTVPRSMYAMIVGSVYSSRHGLPWLLMMISSFVFLFPGQLKDFVNRNWIGVRPLATKSKVLLHIANGMALTSKNVHANYKISGVPSFVMSKIK
jgi:hypothetical protein